MSSSPAIVVDVNILATVIANMGITNVDVPSLFNNLAQESLKNPPSPYPFKIWQRPLNAPGGPTTSTIGESSLSPEEKAKRQELLERAKADFKEMGII